MSSVSGEPFFGFRGEDIKATAGALAREASTNPALVLEEEAELVRDVTRVLAGQSEIKPSAHDKRFTDVAWSENPFYRVFLGGYLAWSKVLDEYVDKTSFDERTKGRVRFVTELITSALAPSNSLANPAALKRVIDTGGGSVVHGLQNMMRDLFTNGGMPAQVDKSAFEVGRNIATTEGSVVFRNDLLELIQYKPRTEHVYALPLLVVPPQINRFYIFDLSPHNSLFKFLVEGGLQVFTISWRNATPANRDWGIETYVTSILEAIDAVKSICGTDKINVAGACVGGLTLTALLGYLAAGDETSPLNSATHLVSVLSLGSDSVISLLATKDVIKAAKAASALRGVLDGGDMGRIFAWLRPDDLVWSYWINNYLLGKDPPAFDILYWNSDTTRLPAKFHADLLDLYAEGRFLRPGATTILGRPVDLGKVSLDAYFIAGITDHIAEWKSVYKNMLAYHGDKTMVLSAAGHIQSIVNPPALAAKRQYLLNAEHSQNPSEWLKGAKSTGGSWWSHWLDWLQRRSGMKIDASAVLGNAQYQPLAAAPGTYVLQK